MFDTNDFVESVIERGRSLDQIVEEARVDILLIESRSIRAEGSSDHVRFLRSLVFFLLSVDKVKPANLSADKLQLLHRLTQHLVDRGDFSPDILELFGTRE